MRCADVFQELAAPHRRDPAALAEHLAHCPRCAAYGEQAARLDRLWEATRPEEPSPAAWTAVWSHVTQTLDAAPLPQVHTSPVLRPRPWRRRAFSLIATAQAAVLLAAALYLGRPGPRPAPETVATVPQAEARPGVKPAPPRPVETVATADVAPGPATATARGGAEVEIDWGSLALIKSGPKGLTVVSQGHDEASGAVDPSFRMLNELEAMAR
jgi:hypothetical protein